MVSFYHAPNGVQYRELLKSMEDTEEDSEETSPLTSPSTQTLKSLSCLQGPPLPPRSTSGIKWRHPFQFCSQPSSTNSHRPPHSFFINSTHKCLKDQQKEIECNEKIKEWTCSNSSNAGTTSNKFLCLLKDEVLHDPYCLDKQSSLTGRMENECKNIKSLNGHTTSSNVVVHIDNNGFPSSALSSTTDALKTL